MSLWLSQTSLMRLDTPAWLEEICQRITSNDPNLSIIELTHQRIDDRQALILAEALQENTVVEVVVLSCYAIVDNGAYALASVLGKSKSIKKVQLRDLRNSREAVTFFKEVARNQQLEEFSLRHCQVCQQSSRLLHNMIQSHKQLKEVRFVDTQFLHCSFSEICQGFEKNSSVLRLYFVNTDIYPDSGARCLSKLIKANQTIEELFLSENQLGDEGTEILVQGLLKNQSLQKLDLRSNGIEVEGSMALSTLITRSTTLNSLGLAMNGIGDVGIAAIAQGIQHHQCYLQDLDVSDNRIGHKGAAALSNSLLTNTRLQDLNLAFNSIGSMGAISIASVLDQNVTLRRLSLRRNGIDNMGACAFATKLPTMRGLKELVMINNPIDHEGSRELLQGLRNNMELVYLHVGDKKSEPILKEIFHWIRLNQAGRRIFRRSDLPLALWPRMLSRLTMDNDVLFHFLSQKPEILEYSYT
mmetsp:Transcript_23802/g.44234  ORF Transcript_23802/g.44234 Transcript_23802/m.44234 type:complete len:470 (+) Transcript_23802:79-1488(+)